MIGDPAYRVASRLSFPRLTGTAGERRARAIIGEEWESAGISFQPEYFVATDYAIRKAARWALAPTGALLFAATLALDFGFHLAAALLAVCSLFPPPLILLSIGEAFKQKKGSRFLAANLVGRAGRGGATSLVLMAHYDSKSQTFPIWLRVVLFLAGGFGAGLLFVLVMACAFLGWLGVGCPFADALPFAGAAVFLACGAHLANRTGNLSDGALDNATGVGIITEIGARLAADMPEGLDLWVVATAAEEIGLCGSFAFLEAHGPELASSRAVFLNFDGCGGGPAVHILSKRGFPPRAAPSPLVRTAHEAAALAKAALARDYIPFGLATDLTPALRAGYAGLDFIGLAGSSHSAKDRIDQTTAGSLADYVKVGEGMARLLAKGQGG